MSLLTWRRAIVGLGIALVLVAIAWATGTPPVEAGVPGVVETVVTTLVVLAGLVAVLWQLWRSPGPSIPGADDPLGSASPEVTSTDAPLAGRELAETIDRAGREARAGWTTEDGLEVVRPTLRGTLRAALVLGGMSRKAAESAIDDGAWTDDREAAAVLSEAVDPPPRTLRQRLAMWLYPERAVRGLVANAARAVAEAADDALPAVAGQRAVRTVPVVRPGVDDLRGHVDGSLRPAANPEAVDHGPRPAGGAGGNRDGGSER